MALGFTFTTVRAPGQRSVATPAGVTRRAALAGGPAALLATLGLTACGTIAPADPPAFAVRRPQPGPPPEPDPPQESIPDTAAGERLNVALLRRFYARHRFQPVWPDRGDAAEALVAAVLRAEAHGLDPELFHAAALRRAAELAPPDREWLLSDAVLSYADALAHGVVPADRRRPAEALTPDRVDVAAALDAAIGSPDPAAVLESLAPATPSYAALRRALAEGTPGPAPAGRAAADRRRMLEANLERQRWLPRALPPDRVWVNVADQRVVLYRADRPVFSARVVVGADAERDQSPEFRTEIEGIFLNPPWVVPKDIVDAELLPRIRRDPDYLARNNMVLRDDGEVEQRAGPDAGLGYLMLDMPNRFDVYLHDTPGRHVFARDDRRLSHGCIRVENPRDLAALLMEEPVEAIDRGITTGETTRLALPHPVPVFLVYETAFADPDGTLRFRPDFYGRDARLWQRTRANPAADPPRAGPPPAARGQPANRRAPARPVTPRRRSLTA
ncbi:L,D-transpeptidase family protein [Roseomonas sp. CCTCC AB2023176]|uniref:L,D-transpeptidase family protein n=1 Tax=Roseomonas sp. CCTCC AB2023176 TaxID=3342640 RepID=UPI0035DDC98B